MKLSEVIQFSSNHDKFLTFLKARQINPDTVHEILAKITNVSDAAVEFRIYFDFGNPGQSSSDVRVIVDFDKVNREFNFIQIDNPTR